jgi:hypothetical protein
MATNTSYYHGIFVPPSSPSNVIVQGVVADVTGASAPSVAASVTYTPMTATGVDTLLINGMPLTVTFNTDAATTVTDAKAIINSSGAAGLVGTFSKTMLATGTATLILTAKAPGTAGEGISVFKTAVSGATGSLNRNFTAGADRWFGQGVGAGPVDGAILGGLGALCTGIGYGTQKSPTKARTSETTSTTAALSTYTPPTTLTDTIFIDGIQFTATFDTDATTTVTALKTLVNACPQVAAKVTATGTTTMVVTANYAGTEGNWISVTSTGSNGASWSVTPYLTAGAGPNVTQVNSAQVGSGLDVQAGAQFAAARIKPAYNSTQGDTVAGVVQAVGASDAVLIAATATYTPPTSSTDVLYINGYALTVTFDTSATITADAVRTAIQAIPWMNNMLALTGTSTVVITRRTRDAYSAPGTLVNGLGPYGNAVTLKSAALHSASLNHADLTGGATSNKGVRLVLSTGTVANGGAVISGWLNEYNPGSSGNPNTGSIATGFVVVGRAS